MKLLTKTLMAMAVAATSFGSMAADESFKSSIRLLAPIQIVEGQDLSFEPTLAYQNIDVVTAPSDVRAAIFSASGSPDEVVVASVEQSSIVMRLNGTGTVPSEMIAVDTFTLGGSLDGTSGEGTFDAAGELKNMRVGGTAHVQADDIAGDYVGTATFRLTYL